MSQLSLRKTHACIGVYEMRDGRIKMKAKQLLTSLGLFLAGATPVKPDREKNKKKGEGY